MNRANLTPNDILEIQRLYSEYNLAIHAADGAAWADCFGVDGVFSNRAREVRGHEALAAYATGFSSDRTARYLINNLVIEGSAAGANGTCYLIILTVPGPVGTPEIQLTGVYTDTLVKLDGEWKFATRHIARDL